MKYCYFNELVLIKCSIFSQNTLIEKEITMKWINNMILLFRSLLSKDEKRLLERAVNLYKTDNGYKISNYDECRSFVKIGYKLDERMEYLSNKGKLDSDDYENTKYKYKCIHVIIKEYSMSA